MRVWELMQQLAMLPAGSEVYICHDQDRIDGGDSGNSANVKADHIDVTDDDQEPTGKWVSICS